MTPSSSRDRRRRARSWRRRSLAVAAATAVRIGAHIGHARQPAADELGACPCSRSGSIRTRMRNISLSRSSLVSTVFGVNCAWLATNTTLAGIDVIGIGVEHDARVGAELDPAGLRGRQINVHVDIGGIEHREDLAAGRQNLADIGDTILDPPVARRDERIVEDVDPIELDIVRRGVERVLRSPQLAGLAAFCRGDGAVQSVAVAGRAVRLWQSPSARARWCGRAPAARA